MSRPGGYASMGKPLNRTGLAVAAALLAAACANSGTAVSEQENMLASAGFAPKKADTPARMASLKSLPPHQFVIRNIRGRSTYLYADPTACGCIYVGDQNAYDQYRQKIASR